MGGERAARGTLAKEGMITKTRKEFIIGGKRAEIRINLPSCQLENLSTTFYKWKIARFIYSLKNTLLKDKIFLSLVARRKQHISYVTAVLSSYKLQTTEWIFLIFFAMEFQSK